MAWASGGSGTVLLTLDGGKSWKSRGFAGTEELDFRDVEGFDWKTAVLMSAGPGAKSRIYRTEDGGANWKLSYQNTDTDGFFDSMAFWDRKRGILVGDPVGGRFTVLTTADGGKSWTRVPAAGLPPANEGEGAFAASGTAIAVYKGGLAWFATGGEKGARVFRSKDWGRTWEVAQTPVRHDGASAGIFSVAFADARHGFVAGGDYRKTGEARDTLAVTSDGGKTWTAVAGLGGFRSAVALVGKKDMWVATGPDGTDVSYDGGRSWTPIPGAGFHSISGRFASGFDGRIAILKLRNERN
ncbi:oxidoreductase [Bryobacterales bacterium F-183]|nr:oxidoreductase [Bryobacterales bacterium F-183]